MALGVVPVCQRLGIGDKRFRRVCQAVLFSFRYPGSNLLGGKRFFFISEPHGQRAVFIGPVLGKGIDQIGVRVCLGTDFRFQKKPGLTGAAGIGPQSKGRAQTGPGVLQRKGAAQRGPDGKRAVLIFPDQPDLRGRYLAVFPGGVRLHGNGAKDCLEQGLTLGRCRVFPRRRGEKQAGCQGTDAKAGARHLIQIKFLLVYLKGSVHLQGSAGFSGFLRKCTGFYIHNKTGILEGGDFIDALQDGLFRQGRASLQNADTKQKQEQKDAVPAFHFRYLLIIMIVSIGVQGDRIAPCTPMLL